MKGIRFRTFQSQDISAIQALIIETISVCYASFPLAYRQHWIEEHHSKEHIITGASEGYTLVLEHRGNIIGIGTLLLDEIRGVFIHPNYQLRELGTELLIRLEKRAKQQSIQEVQVYALPPSRPFFERLGYHTISEHQFKDQNLQQFKYYVLKKQI